MAVVVLYPCSQFDYIISGRTESDAQELFEAWMAAHHPALIGAEGVMPRWETASYPSYNLQKDVLIVPPCCESYWSESWEKQSADCTLIRNTVNRDEIVQQVFAARNCPASPLDAYSFDEGFIADCYALGVARFLTSLLNKNLYYVQIPDETRLHSLMSDAIKALKENQPHEVHRAMQSAFSEVARAKDTYHPTQNYYIELILVTQTVTGEPLRQLLCREDSMNLFLPSGVLKTLPETSPDTFSQLKSAAEQGKVRFITDGSIADDVGTSSPTLLPILDVADHILAGISVYRELLNITPAVYGCLTTPLSPALPQLLKLAEMKGAIHFAPLAGWKIKENEQSKIVWQGTDNTNIDALVRYPIDATTYLGFFELADQLATQMHHDQVPTSVFALFPGQKSVWLEMLRRMTRYTTGLGKFSDIENYFSDTTHSGGIQRFGNEKYPVNALMEAEQNPLSRWNDLYRHSTDRLVHASLETLLNLLNRSVTDVPLVQQFVETITSKSGTPSGSAKIAVNPLSFARKMYVDDMAVDVPPLGFAYTEPPVQSETPAKKSLLGQFFDANKRVPVLVRKAEDDIGRGERRSVYVLENRYFSAKFDALSGALRSIFTNRSRYNQLSRQIAFRQNKTYSIPAADEIVITKATTEAGQIKIAGRLVCPDGAVAARFTETVTIRSQSRLLEFDLTLEPLVDWNENRWNSYIAVRYAWNDDTLEMRGGLNDSVHRIPEWSRFHAPKVIDLRNAESSLTFLSEGLPFHQRSGDRQLDTLLMVKGESLRQFRLGIAVNATHPVKLSYDFLLKQDDFIFPVPGYLKNSSARPDRAWFFQIESNNVIALHWEPQLESDKLTGYTVYLLETEGRRAHFALRSFVSPKQAAAMNLLGKELKKFRIDGDAVLIDMHAHEVLPLKVQITET